MKEILLTRGFVALIDDEDHLNVSQFSWQVLCTPRGHTYAVRRTWDVATKREGKAVLMHRQLLQPDSGLVVDHIDGNGLNNQRSNLRLATRAQNAVNVHVKPRGRSKFRGVYWNNERRLWQSQIGAGLVNGRQKVLYLGRFSTEEEAARAYDSKALEMHGDFAKLNFPRTS